MSQVQTQQKNKKNNQPNKRLLEEDRKRMSLEKLRVENGGEIVKIIKVCDQE